MSMKEFKIGDTVQIGLNGEKGKVIDIYKPVGTYCMYKIHMMFSGKVKQLQNMNLWKEFLILISKTCMTVIYLLK